MNLSHYLKTELFVAFSLESFAPSCPTFSSMFIELAKDSKKKSLENQSFPIAR